jgi:hypothetical protein
MAPQTLPQRGQRQHRRHRHWWHWLRHRHRSWCRCRCRWRLVGGGDTRPTPPGRGGGHCERRPPLARLDGRSEHQRPHAPSDCRRLRRWRHRRQRRSPLPRAMPPRRHQPASEPAASRVARAQRTLVGAQGGAQGRLGVWAVCAAERPAGLSAPCRRAAAVGHVAHDRHRPAVAPRLASRRASRPVTAQCQ